MKVIIKNATGTDAKEALLDKDSGVIEFKNGEISHVLFEKNFNRIITVVKDAPRIEQVETESSSDKPKKKPTTKKA